MKDQYNISEQVYQELLTKVTVLDLIELIPKFSPTDSPVTAVSLMLVFDKYGDFTETQESKEQIIAKAVFDCLDSSDKVAVMTYIDNEVYGDG